ncbi:MAG: hypothetical protein VXW58_09525, partial [Pseudomonadota bacterium]|nr:hypothetical protein [Pseudomonadota bacterium]
MKPEFALSLSFEGITLLHRSGSGWRHVGDVLLDAPDLRGELAALRAKARLLSDDRLTTKLILPNDQIRYLSVETGSFEGDARREIVRAALEGATPYSVSELVFDTSPEGRTTHVAAVAKETLEEAAGFASEHKFNPIGFVAVPGDQPFLGEPWFGTPEGVRANTVEPDGIAVVVIGPAIYPEPKHEEAEPTKASESHKVVTDEPALEDQEPAPATDATPEAAKQPEPDQPDPDESFAAQFTSRRKASTRPKADASQNVANAGAAVTAPRIDVAPDALDDGAPPLSPPRLAAIMTRSGRQEPPVARPVAPPPTGAEPVETPPAEGTEDGEDMAGAIAPPPPAAPRVTLPDRQAPTSEAARMTVFGARGGASIGGKPRHLGLMLTAALLVFLAGVAAWASLFLDDGVAGLFGTSEETEFVAQTGTATAPDTAAPLSEDTAPAPVDIASLPAPRAVESPA